MDTQKIIELFLYSLPAIITGGVAYLFFKKHTENEAGIRLHALQKETQKTALPLRLQAFERMALFLERINPSQLMLRVSPISTNKNDYASLLISNIEQEFEHNLTQQIYISNACWDVIKSAKNTTITMVRNTAGNPNTIDAKHLREVLLTSLLEKASPSATAMSYVKNELKEIFS